MLSDRKGPNEREPAAVLLSQSWDEFVVSLVACPYTQGWGPPSADFSVL